MTLHTLYDSFQRYRTLRSHRISSLPIVILMPHSSCNCRCSMCDIWKANQHLKQLREEDVERLMDALSKLRVKQVLMSGGEPLLHPNFFRLCKMLQEKSIQVVLLSTGLTLARHAENIVKHVQEVIVSLDGDPDLHDRIRNIAGAYTKLENGVRAIKSLDPGLVISARSVIHKLNFRNWRALIDTARNANLDSISFLPADVSSHAFNRELSWEQPRQEEILLNTDELAALEEITEEIIRDYSDDIATGFIAESPTKLRQISQHYAAALGLADYPYRPCNAPWVSTVIEPDGTVRPCFFHKAIGNIHEEDLLSILNGPTGMDFRKTLDMQKDHTCLRCVCTLNLHPRINPANL